MGIGEGGRGGTNSDEVSPSGPAQENIHISKPDPVPPTSLDETSLEERPNEQGSSQDEAIEGLCKPHGEISQVVDGIPGALEGQELLVLQAILTDGRGSEDEEGGDAAHET